MLFEDATLVGDERERIKNMVESCSLEELSESLSRIAGRFLPTRTLFRTTGPREGKTRDDDTTLQPPSPKLTTTSHIAGRLPAQNTHSPSCIVGLSHTLRVGFYLPVCYRDCETMGRQDNRTSGRRYNRTPPHVAGLPSHCGSSSAHCPSPKHSRSPYIAGLPSLCGSSHALSPQKAPRPSHFAGHLSLCG